MARRTIDRGVRAAIRSAQKMVEELERSDGNESETRRRVERLFDTLMGYDPFKHLSREHAIHGAGETEHVDFAIHVDGPDSAPRVMVELKRVGIDLAAKHLKQVSSYAINAGCEWIILTNARHWRLYHVSFGQPPETKLLKSWNLLQDDPAELAKCFEMVSFKSIRKGTLDDQWQKINVLSHKNTLGAILGESSVKLLRRELKRTTGTSVALEDIVAAVRRLLNEAALTELGAMRITFTPRKQRTRKNPTVEVEAAQTKSNVTPEGGE